MIQIFQGFEDAHRDHVARLFWAAFSGKLGVLLGPDAKGQRFIANVLQPRFALCAVEDGNILGVAGFKTPEGGLIGGELPDLTPIYGPFGGLWRGLLLDRMERELTEGQLLMDGVFVDEAARGRGVGTLLLDAVLAQAKSTGAREVRLDVIDSNPRARALYERQGFTAYGEVDTWPLHKIFGFRKAVQMRRFVGD